MDFGVLGPLRVVERGTDRSPTAPKQRQMLALMLLNANRVVSQAQLVEELWGYTPPSSAVAAVHTYVMQLRRSLSGGDRGGEGQAGRLLTRNHGYLLKIRTGELDFDVWQATAARARAALAAGHVDTAARQWKSAERVWRGQLLVDVTIGPLLYTTMEAVDRERLDMLSHRIGAELQLGRHLELLGELSALTHTHPTREDLIGHLMVALYRAGRQADALEVFHRLRHTLRAELATGPSAYTERLYTDMLTTHPRLEFFRGSEYPQSLNLLAEPVDTTPLDEGKERSVTPAH